MSEIAELRKKIEMEYEAMQRGLVGLASGTARHDFIHARMQKVALYQEQLAEHVGEANANDVVCELYDESMSKHTEPTSPTEPEAKQQTLWMFICRESGAQLHELVPLYATSQEDADQQAKSWLEKNPRNMLYVELREYPNGFVIHTSWLPGEI